MRIDCAADVVVQVVAPVTKRCPFADERDHGEVTISWSNPGLTLELHALRAWLAEFRDEHMSHEDFTQQVWERISDELPLAEVTVSSTWTTADMAVTVTAVG